MVLACAALLVTAVLLPALVLRPTSFFEAGKEKLAESAPPSRGQLFNILEQRALRELGPEAALSSSLQKPFAFPTHARDDAIFGIDISHHNTDNCDCRIDWNLVASQKVAFIYIKATEGVSYKDKAFDDHWRALSQHPKLHRGAYHFLRGDVDIEQQAKIFLSKMGRLQSDDLPPSMDLEWDVFKDSTRKRPPADGNDYWSNLEPDEIIEKTLKWLKLVEKETGRIPVIYTSRQWWVERIRDEKKLDLFKRYPLWISAMEDKDLQLEKPGTKGGWANKWEWKLWQFTNKGDLTRAGIPNPANPKAERVDVNIFPGTLEQFRQAFGIARTIEIAAIDSPKVPSSQQTNRTSDSAARESSAAAASRTKVASNSGAESRSAPVNDSGTAIAPGTKSGSTVTGKSSAANTPATASTTATASAASTTTSPGTGSSATNGESGTANTPATASSAATTSAANMTTSPETGSGVAGGESSAANTPATASSAAAANAANVTTSPETGSSAAGDESNAANTPATASSAATASAANVTTTPETGSSAASSEPSAANTPGTESGAGTASGADTGKTPAAGSGTRPRRSSRVENGTSPLSAFFRKSMVEIALVNGRVIRVDSNIDPAVLARLIAVLDGP
jgi:lysozyme